MKLLIIEDEADLSSALAAGLAKCGYASDIADDGAEGLELAFINEYDLIILDLNLPSMDGLSVLSEIRKRDKCQKVLILSARGQVSDKVLGLDAGANDYLTKPFHFDELLARVRSLLRRSFVQENVELCCGALSLNTKTRQAYLNGRALDLTKTELCILEYLMQNSGRAVSCEELMEHVYDSEADLFSNAVKVHIHSLRKKMANNMIQNVRGQGYKVQPDAACK